MISLKKKYKKTFKKQTQLGIGDVLEIECPKGYDYADIKIEITAHKRKKIKTIKMSDNNKRYTTSTDTERWGNNKKILEEFDKKYSLEKDYPQGLVDGCKDFLISKLKEQRQEIVEMIEKYATKQGKNNYDNESEEHYYAGRRDGLWDIINLIQNKSVDNSNDKSTK